MPVLVLAVVFGRGGVDLGATIATDLLICPAALLDIAAALCGCYKYKHNLKLYMAMSSWVARLMAARRSDGWQQSEWEL